MSVLLSFLCVGPAWAGDVFSSLGPEQSLGTGGNWARLHAREGGYWFFQASGRDAWASPLDEDLGGYDEQDRLQLTARGNLQDIQVERCEDGGFLIGASYTTSAADDSLRAWRLDPKLQVTGERVLVEGDASQPHNDPIPFCAGGLLGVAHQDSRKSSASTFQAWEGADLSLDFEAMGGSLALRERDGALLGVDVRGPSSSTLRVAVFEPDGSLRERVEVPVPQGQAFWPQRLLPLGDGWVLATLARSGEGQGTDGEVWLLALDADLQVLDSLRVSEEGTQNGRPWVTRLGDRLAVSYDRDLQPRARLVGLNGEVVPGDDGLPDTGGPSGDGGGQARGDDASEGCSCAQGAGGVLGPWLALPALVRRRLSSRRAGC